MRNAPRLADTTDPELTNIHLGYHLTENERDIVNDAKIEEAKNKTLKRIWAVFLPGKGTSRKLWLKPEPKKKTITSKTLKIINETMIHLPTQPPALLAKAILHLSTKQKNHQNTPG